MLLKICSCIILTCARCREEEETVENPRITCLEVKKIWFASQFSIRIDGEVHSFDDWLGRLMRVGDEDFLVGVYHLLWVIWTSINQWVLRGKGDSPCLGQSSIVLGVWDTFFGATRASVQVIIWGRPKLGYININFDASIRAVEGTRWGLVAIHQNGEVVAATTNYSEVHYPLEIGEVLALRWALQMAHDLYLFQAVLKLIARHFMINGVAKTRMLDVTLTSSWMNAK